jgi:hypothetical protein
VYILDTTQHYNQDIQSWSTQTSRHSKLKKQLFIFLLLVLLQLEDYKSLFWMHFSMYYFFDKLAGDTCIALDDYQLNPQISTLGTIIPCRDKLSGDQNLNVSKNLEISNLV